MNVKTYSIESLQYKSHQNNRHLGYPSGKILGTILKMNKGETLRNRPEDMNVDNDAQGITCER